MPKELDYGELRACLEDALFPLKESVGAVAPEFFALRECIDEGNLGELDAKIEKAEKMVSRCHALLEQRMVSFEQRLFSGIDARLRDRLA